MNPNWTLARTSNPSGLAVSLDEAKKHLRISGNSQDEELLLLIEASTEKLERDITRGLIQCSWQQSMYAFPKAGEPIAIMMGSTTRVSSITYIDVDGVTQTLSADQWSFSFARGVVFNTTDDWWPEVSQGTVMDKVFINFNAGQADGQCVPRLFKQAILLEVGRAYFDPAQENGVNTNDGRSYEAIVFKLLRSTYP